MRRSSTLGGSNQPVRRQVLALIVSVVVCFSAMALGGLATSHSVRTWYPTLNKPAWTPPSYLFGVVWPILYLSMAVSVWLVWRERGFRPSSPTLLLFAVQLVLNTAWSYLFFGAMRPDLAFLEITLLASLIAATIVAFWRVRPLAALLLVPYLAWVVFATCLNFAIWRLNS